VLKVLKWTLVVVIALPVFAWAVLYGDSVWQRRKAEKLFKEFQALTPGMATTADVRALMERYSDRAIPDSACSPNDCVYQITVENYRALPDPVFQRLPGGSVLVMDRTGLRLWNVYLYVDVKHGLLQMSRYSLRLLSSARFDCYYAIASVEKSQTNQSHYVGENKGAKPYSVHPTNLTSRCYGEPIRIELDNRATEQERARAYDLRFSFMTNFYSNIKTADIAPAPWQDWMEAQRKQDAEPSLEE
jgi:hypothetical protein